MANQYHWKIIAINSVEHGDLTGVVTLAQWELWATDGVKSAMMLGQSQIPVSNTDQFIARESLQESDVLAWVADSFTPDQLSEVLAEVDRRLVSAETTLSVRLPWAPITVALTDEQASAISAAQNIINVDNNP